MVALSLIATPMAYADETTTINDDGTLTLSITYLSTQVAPTLPSTLEEGKQSYILESSSRSVDPLYIPSKREYTRQTHSQVPAHDHGNWSAYLPSSYAIDDGEYQGSLDLDPTNPYTVYEATQSYLVQVDKQKTITELPDNDVTRLPTHQSFDVVSDTTPGATMAATLKILDVTYEVAGRDSLGYPNNYTAHVTYRGQEGLHEVAYYDVVANYAGEIVSSIGQMVITGVYALVAEEEDEPVAEPSHATITRAIEQPPVPLAQPEPSSFPLAIAAAMVAVFLATPLLYFLIMPNAQLIRVVGSRREAEGNQALNNQAEGSSQSSGNNEANGKQETSNNQAASSQASEDQTSSKPDSNQKADANKQASVKKQANARKQKSKQGKVEHICRRRMVLRQGTAEFRIPGDIDIFNGDHYRLIIKRRLAYREGNAQMTWQGRIVAVMPLNRYLDINFREMMITSAEAALMECGLLS